MEKKVKCVKKLGLLIFMTVSLIACGKEKVETDVDTSGNDVMDIIQQMSEDIAERKSEERAIEEAQAHESEDQMMSISSAEELIIFRNRVNNGEQALGATLMADIDLSTVCGPEIGNWNPIQIYNGIFDGNNHIISGLYIDGSEEKCGLFAEIKRDGVVKNLGMKDFIIKANSYAGSVAGCNYGLLENCWSDGEVSSDSKSVGGVAGYASIMKGCYNLGSVTATSGTYPWVGGVAGEISNTIEGCYNEGMVSGDGYYLGGVAGLLANERASSEAVLAVDCYNKGKVTAHIYGGGVFGFARNGIINRCWNLGDVESVFVSSGIVGRSAQKRGTSLLIENCFNKGSVSAKGWQGFETHDGNIFDYQYAAGICAELYYCSVVNCYNTGDIFCDTDEENVLYCGGLVLSFFGDSRTMPYVYNCYSSGNFLTESTQKKQGIGVVLEYTDNVYYVYGTQQPGWTPGEGSLSIEIPGTALTEFTNGNVLSKLQSWPENANDEKLEYLVDYEYELSTWKMGADGFPCFEWEN